MLVFFKKFQNLSKLYVSLPFSLVQLNYWVEAVRLPKGSFDFINFLDFVNPITPTFVDIQSTAQLENVIERFL